MPQVSDLYDRRICLHIERIKLGEHQEAILTDVSFAIIQSLKFDLDYLIMIGIGALFGGGEHSNRLPGGRLWPEFH